MQRITSATTHVALFGTTRTREIEARVQAALAPQALMQRAGDAVARLAVALAPHARRIWIAAGPGNNGGDGLEAALCLRRDGRNVGVLLCGAAESLPADAGAALARAQQAGIAFDSAGDRLNADDLAIDALLGIGGSRPPQGAIAAAIRRLNALACPVLAVDVPSGLDADSGQPFGAECVVAAHTLTLLTAKPGLFTAAGRDHAGAVWLERLGIDDTAAEADAALVGSGSLAASRELRRQASNKGSFGDVAIVGGGNGMVGAALLAGRAAHAAGAGRVYLALLADVDHAPGFDPLRPELMMRPGWCDGPPKTLATTTVVCGCGGGEAVRSVLPRLVSLVGKLVLDADGLNAIATDSRLAATLRSRASRGLHTILTPHPLEAARLLGADAAAVQADRLAAARMLADRYAAVVILKGSGSVIAAPGRVTAIAATGNASLATAGTGDVLAGWLGGLWAQRGAAADAGSAFDVAVRAAVEHGAAAEPEEPGPLRAGDLVDVLHRRLRQRR